MIMRLTCAALTALAIGATAPLAAQDNGTVAEPTTLSEVTPDKNVTADSVTDEQVVAFVQALVAIREVSTTYMPRIDAETDGSKRAALIDEANTAIYGAVDRVENLSPQEYVAIDRVAQSDEALAARIAAVIQASRRVAPKTRVQDDTRCVMGKCE